MSFQPEVSCPRRFRPRLATTGPEPRSLLPSPAGTRSSCSVQRRAKNVFIRPVSLNPVTCPNLADVASTDSRSGNTPRSQLRIWRAELALHKRVRTGVCRGQQRPRQQSRLGWRARKLSTVRSTLLRSPCTWGSARSGRSPPLPIAAAERSERACRVPSDRSPRRSAGQRRILAPREAQPAIANWQCPRFQRGTPATAAGARTISRRTLHPLPATQSRLANHLCELPLDRFQVVHVS